MMEPRLLKPKMVVVREYKLLTCEEAIKVITSHKKKKNGILEAAYEVDDIDGKFFNVRMEYIAK